MASGAPRRRRGALLVLHRRCIRSDTLRFGATCPEAERQLCTAAALICLRQPPPAPATPTIGSEPAAAAASHGCIWRRAAIWGLRFARLVCPGDRRGGGLRRLAGAVARISAAHTAAATAAAAAAGDCALSVRERCASGGGRRPRRLLLLLPAAPSPAAALRDATPSPACCWTGLHRWAPLLWWRCTRPPIALQCSGAGRTARCSVRYHAERPGGQAGHALCTRPSILSTRRCRQQWPRRCYAR